MSSDEDDFYDAQDPGPECKPTPAPAIEESSAVTDSQLTIPAATATTTTAATTAATASAVASDVLGVAKDVLPVATAATAWGFDLAQWGTELGFRVGRGSIGLVGAGAARLRRWGAQSQNGMNQ